MIETTAFKGRRVMITGGMGFIGSNLAIELIRLGAHVTIADAMIPGYGGNLFNIEPIHLNERLHVNFCDICSEHIMNHIVQDQDYIFHLAGQVDHVLSQSNPYPDIDINIRGTVNLMQACKLYNPDVKVIFSGTRGEYGPATSLPVSETAPTNPRGIYEVSNLAAEQIIKIYHDIHSIQSVMLRITNTYGPRSQMQHSRYGVANWFVRLALDSETIKVFGDGRILRDFLYVDDCVEAMLVCALTPCVYGEVLNVGDDTPYDFVTLADCIVGVAGTGRWEFAPFSPERAAQEPGDFYSDISKIRCLTGWSPKVCLEEGLRRTIDYYAEYRGRYW
jgi:UDP-glucose 4-epimerase